jgi:hypothetical protein
MHELLKALMFSALVIIGAIAASEALAADDSILRDSAVLTVGVTEWNEERGAWRTSQCSGTVIAPDRVLTAKHCIDAAAYIRDRDGIWHRTAGGRIHDTQDAAVLWVPGIRCPCAPIASHIVMQNAEARAVGFPLGAWHDDTGAIFGIEPDTGTLAHAARTWFGASGGGLWQQQDGQWVLIGVHDSIMLTLCGVISFAAPITEIGGIL